MRLHHEILLFYTCFILLLQICGSQELENKIADDDIPVVEGHGGDVHISVESDVLVLNEGNFDIIVMSKPIILVEFYAPWCGHCKNLEPHYAKAASMLKDHKPPIPLAKVDATAHEGLAKRYEISGFPTLLLFRNGSHIEYDGPRTTQGIVDYMTERVDPNWKPAPETVITLTIENFDSVVSKEELILVEFYAPWCGHCKRLAPEYERAAKLLKKLPMPIKLAKVDATLETDLAKKYDVKGYPTLIMFRKGKRYNYDGARDEQGIVHYLKSQQSPPTVEVKSATEVEKKTPIDYPVIAGVFSSLESKEFEVFEDTMNRLRSQPYELFHVVNTSVAKEIKENVNSLVIITGKLVRSEYEPIRKRMSIRPETSSDDILHFIGNNSIPLVGHRSRRTLSFYVNRYPLCVVYYDVDFSFDGRVDTEIIRRKVVDVAKKFVGKVTFAISKESDFDDEIKDLKLDESGEDVNAGIFMSNRLRFAFAPNDEFDSGDLEEFVDEVLEGKGRPIIKSLPIPERQDGHVVTVVGLTFEELVMKNTKNVLIEFFAPWCGHCQRLEPIYKRLADEFKDNDDIVVAKFDATQNDVPIDGLFDFGGFPTVFYVPRRAKTSVVVYNGDRSFQDLSKFVNDQLNRDVSQPSFSDDRDEL